MSVQEMIEAREALMRAEGAAVFCVGLVALLSGFALLWVVFKSLKITSMLDPKYRDPELYLAFAVAALVLGLALGSGGAFKYVNAPLKARVDMANYLLLEMKK